MKEILSLTDLYFCIATLNLFYQPTQKVFLEEQALNHIKPVIESNISFLCYKNMLEEREISHYSEENGTE